MAWYAIHVRTGSEEKVCEEIRKQLARVDYAKECQLLVPKRKLQEKRQGEWFEVVRIMFPGYVLMQSEDIEQIVELTKDCKGVYRYLESEGELQKVWIEEIAMLLQMINNDGIINISEAHMEDGWVQVISGPLKGLEGLIKKIDKHKQRAKIRISFDGKEHLIDVGIQNVLATQ